MEWSPDRRLQFRMALTVAGAAIVALCFASLAFVVAGVLCALLGIPPAWRTPCALVLAAGALGWVGLVEYRLPERLVARPADVRPASPETDARLHGVLTRVAQSADVPPPSLAVYETATPLAYTVGFRSRDATLVVSTGLLDALDDEQVAAVLAHEVSHVKHRDVAVTTVVSFPAALAAAVQSFADDHWAGLAERGGASPAAAILGIAAVACYAVAGLFHVVGRVLCRGFSRTREFAADRGAAAITGNPAALASALRTLDDADPPAEDLRTALGVIAQFTVTPPRSADSTVGLGPDGERTATYTAAARRLRERLAGVLATHPPTEERVAALAAMTTEVEHR